MLAARVVASVSWVLAALALSGCSVSWGCTDTTAERGRAEAKVQVVGLSGRPVGVSAEVIDWGLEPHPQEHAKGDRVHFHYRFIGAEGTQDGPHLDVCAVDKQRVVLICDALYASGTRPGPGKNPPDAWLFPEDPQRVSAVLLIPNDKSVNRRSCEQDPKDGGGTHPPLSPGPGDQL